MFNMLALAKGAKVEVAGLSASKKNEALEFMAKALLDNENIILEANKIDLEKARGTVSDVMLDRLMLNRSRLEGMAKGILEVKALPDPVNRVLEEHVREDGLRITKISVPLGVIAIIYESRPNVTSDAAALALKSGNVAVLRGGKEAFNSANAIVNALKEGLKKAGITENAVNLVQDTTRESATQLMTANEYVDMLIPRGGAGLISACVKNATVPCIQTGTGICHVYVEKTADLEKAIKIIENAKTSRPSVCNAEEVLLVDNAIKNEFLPMVYSTLVEKRIKEGKIPVELRLHESAQGIIEGVNAGERDFDTEFLDYILAVKCVEDVFEAIKHISEHSTGHSEAIVTNDEDAKKAFIQAVDSSSVYINSSTRFTDGGEFGLGCEMGISTQKLHARGPMGLRELNTYKYVIYGDGHIR
ncbi:MAG: glutamate-5-semialdehyde dehydrogenase [Clostridia bacterium]|nr:glutamate-5-semialdehyde dehydrogenase [Clostridia bacterium]